MQSISLIMHNYNLKNAIRLLIFPVIVLFLASFIYSKPLFAQAYPFEFNRHQKSKSSSSKGRQQQVPVKPQLSKKEQKRTIAIWKTKGNDTKEPTRVRVYSGEKYVEWKKTIFLDYEGKRTNSYSEKRGTVVGSDYVKEEWFPEYYSDKKTPFGRSLIHPHEGKPKPKIIFVGIDHKDDNPGQRTDVEDAAYLISLQAQNPKRKIIAYYEELPEGTITSLDGTITDDSKVERLKRHILESRKVTIPSQIGSIERLIKHDIEIKGLETSLGHRGLAQLKKSFAYRHVIDRLVDPALIEHESISKALPILIYLERAGGNPIKMKVWGSSGAHRQTVDAIDWLQNRAVQIDKYNRESKWVSYSDKNRISETWRYHTLERGIVENPDALHVMFLGNGHVLDITGTDTALYRGIEAIEKKHGMEIPYLVFGLKENLPAYTQLQTMRGYMPKFDNNPWHIDHYRNYYELGNGPDPYMFDYLNAYPRHLNDLGQPYGFPHPKDYETPGRFYRAFMEKAFPFYNGMVKLEESGGFTNSIYNIYHDTLKDNELPWK